MSTTLDGLTENQVVAEAFTYVRDGFALALMVRRLPEVERRYLLDCYLAAAKIVRDNTA